jgi:hypothetical protein
MKDFFIKVKKIFLAELPRIICILFFVVVMGATFIIAYHADNSVRIGNSGLYIQSNDNVVFTYDTIYVKDVWRKDLDNVNKHIFDAMADTLSANNFLRDHKEEDIYVHQIIYNKQIAKNALDSLNIKKKELEKDQRQYSNKIHHINVTGIIIVSEEE